MPPGRLLDGASLRFDSFFFLFAILSGSQVGYAAGMQNLRPGPAGFQLVRLCIRIHGANNISPIAEMPVLGKLQRCSPRRPPVFKIGSLTQPSLQRSQYSTLSCYGSLDGPVDEQCRGNVFHCEAERLENCDL